jgi:hypothetical protein
MGLTSRRGYNPHTRYFANHRCLRLRGQSLSFVILLHPTKFILLSLSQPLFDPIFKAHFSIQNSLVMS